MNKSQVEIDSILVIESVEKDSIFSRIIEVSSELARKDENIFGKKAPTYHLLRHSFELLGEEKTDAWISGTIDWLKMSMEDPKDFHVGILHGTLHKSLRQSDVYGDGHLDMILYNVINLPNDCFFELLRKALVSELKNKEYEIEMYALKKSSTS